MRVLTLQELVGSGLSNERAQSLGATLASVPRDLAPSEIWRRLTARPRARGTSGAAAPPPLSRDLPLATHQLVFAAVYEGWDAAQGPPPVWLPEPEDVASSNLSGLMERRGLATYEALYEFSIRDRAAFWGEAIEQLGVVFRQPPDNILAPGSPTRPRWLPGARYNIVESCLAAAPDQIAIVSAGGPDGALTKLTYAELAASVHRVAGALTAAGFVPDDAIAIDMPMTAEAVIIYLALVRSGLRVISIADSLAAAEVATRLRIASARGLFTAHSIDRGGKRLPLYEKLLPAAPPRTVVLDAGSAALRAGDVTWESFLAAAPARPPEAVIGEPDTITNILFSSGTTGDPKAIPWTQLTPIKAATDAAYHFDVKSHDVIAWPTNLGWMMGPWLIYASLLNRATMALYTDAPTTRAFGEFVSRAAVTVLGLVPSIVKAWRSDDRMRGLDWSQLKCFGSTGEASSEVDQFDLMRMAGYRPVIEYCGGTEIGGGYVTGTLQRPAAPATFSTPALGSELVILDEAGQPTANGEVFLVPPTLGYSQTLLNRDHDEVYFAGTPPGPGGAPLRRHGDQIERLPGGYYRALGRVDDTMNLGGIKVSSAELERVLDVVPGVRRTAAIAVNPPGGGPSELVVYAVVDAAHPHAGDREALLRALNGALKSDLNPLFRITELVLIDAMPVTASNKIMRRELRAGHRRI